MCLILYDLSKDLIASEDITVYKLFCMKSDGTLFSPYYYKEYEVGKKYTDDNSSMDIHCNRTIFISKGFFHSCKNIKRIYSNYIPEVIELTKQERVDYACQTIEYGNKLAVCECKIPCGSIYCTNGHDYASRKIVIEKIIKEFQF